MTAIEMIEAQQKGIEETAPWMVGEQLKDICRQESGSAALIEKDLEQKSMSLIEAEKKIKAHADKHRKGSFACVPPSVAETILREFYGLPSATAEASQEPLKPKPAGKLIDLADFL